MTTPQRAAPFYCPYCGEEDLRPYGEAHGGWWCAACRRAWTLRYIGTGTPESVPAVAGLPDLPGGGPADGGVAPR